MQLQLLLRPAEGIGHICLIVFYLLEPWNFYNPWYEQPTKYNSLFATLDAYTGRIFLHSLVSVDIQLQALY